MSKSSLILSRTTNDDVKNIIDIGRVDQSVARSR
jgi:hypothetical protein